MLFNCLWSNISQRFSSSSFNRCSQSDAFRKTASLESEVLKKVLRQNPLLTNFFKSIHLFWGHYVTSVQMLFWSMQDFVRFVERSVSSPQCSHSIGLYLIILVIDDIKIRNP